MMQSSAKVHEKAIQTTSYLVLKPSGIGDKCNQKRTEDFFDGEQKVMSTQKWNNMVYNFGLQTPLWIVMRLFD